MKKLAVTLFSTITMLLMAIPAFAQDKAASGESLGWIALASGIAIGAGAFGGALGQGKTASAALEGIARNPQAAPKVQTPMIIALAMTESLVLFAFVIAFVLGGKVPG